MCNIEIIVFCICHNLCLHSVCIILLMQKVYKLAILGQHDYEFQEIVKRQQKKNL